MRVSKTFQVGSLFFCAANFDAIIISVTRLASVSYSRDKRDGVGNPVAVITADVM